ncbi:MAG: hypothetical protein ACOX1H_07445 [Pseudoramibacter sp.]|jgi:hypothetical protein
MKKIVTAVLAAVLTLTMGFSVFAAEGDSTTSFKIEYDTDTEMHYIPAEIAKQENADGRFLIYCMNNQLHWPHTTPGISSVPDYTEGYLTASDFKSTDEYNTFMSRLMTILYAGYPYNGLGLYQIVKDSTTITEDEFNQLLIVPEDVRSDFKDVLGDTQFTYSDFTNNNTENLNKLSAFLTAVGNYYPSSSNTTNLKTPSGLTYQDLTALPFYRAAWCMYYANSSYSPLDVYHNVYAGSYYVTAEQAYQATQRAVWWLMAEYGIANNNLTATSSEQQAYPLAAVLYQASDASGEILRSEPSSSQVSISGDTTLTYDETEKKWVSGELSVIEPDNYHGTYTLSVTGDDVTVETANGGTTVKAGEIFRLVSDQEAKGSVTATADSMVWLKSMQMYSPNETTATFQHMVGAVMGTKTVSAQKAFNYSAKQEDANSTTDPEDNQDTDSNTTTTEEKPSTTQTQTAASQKQPKEGKSLTAALTGDDSNWTKYADWLVLAALVGTAAVVIKKKTQA